MKNLFLIDGVSGTGKSDFVQFVGKFQRDVELVPKFTTRPQRDYERSLVRPLDLNFVSFEEFESRAFDYQYVYNRERYGFSQSDLEACLSRSNNVFVVVRNGDLIKRLKQDYDFINVVPVFVYTDEEKVRRSERQRGLIVP